MTDIEAASNEAHKKEFRIQIDRTAYVVGKEEMTGKELRHVPAEPIPASRDLFEVRPGEPDKLIHEHENVRIHDGLRFFTAPHHINPGRNR